MNGIPSPKTVIEGYNKFENFGDSAPIVMKYEIPAYLHVVVDDIKAIGQNFPSRNSWRTLTLVLFLLVGHIRRLRLKLLSTKATTEVVNVLKDAFVSVEKAQSEAMMGSHWHAEEHQL